MKPISVLKGSVLAAIFAVSGCETTEYINVTPECTPPPQPVPPEIDQGELWDALGDERYRQLERYINGVWAFSDEQGAMLDSLCE
ncbi:hypothetical protein [Halomonas sp. hl-4]|uniref:hypothetical protein n=1 Tax=Halomonas sp. hl-4 TaxID=1761789 RepID=UPI000BC05B15|nr:hypothetical protein [Halomonas sp. hl-4]SNY95558.1 hypothetical protein SAMN04488142_0059 [Halomonas sp. hl-4]